jgi:hypothetical protein
MKVCIHPFDYITGSVDRCPTSLDHVEPLNATATPSPVGISGLAPQSAYSDDGSNRLWSPAFRQSIISSSQPQYNKSSLSEGDLTYVSSAAARPWTGKAALVAQQNIPQPVRHEGSGARFNENEEEVAGPSKLPTEVPPSYTPH